MKPLFRKIIQASGSSFSLVEESPPLFDTPWHFHPEYELILIENSSGKRFMGDNIAEFDAQELVLIGPNLPHFWQNDPATDLSRARAYVVHFGADFLGETYFNLPELLPVQTLLESARTGLKINGFVNEKVAAILRQLPGLSGFGRLMQLQQALYVLAVAGPHEPLSSLGFVESFQATRHERMSQVYEYVMYNFRQKITLQDVASVASMSEVGFCRYFKKSTGKAFFSFLNEIRIGYACRLLIEGGQTVTEVSYESGFNNLAHFNRQFKTITAQTPQQYRGQFRR